MIRPERIFRLPALRGRPLHLALAMTTTALFSVDLLHLSATSFNQDIALAVPDALASAAAAVVFGAALCEMGVEEEEEQD